MIRTVVCICFFVCLCLCAGCTYQEEPIPIESEYQELTEESVEDIDVSDKFFSHTGIENESDYQEGIFRRGNQDYYNDALFIGDSRTKGLGLYGTLKNADYFAASGMSLYNISKEQVSVGEYVNITLEELLKKEEYGKIYLMLGINELGYDMDKNIKKYEQLLRDLQIAEPEALIYVCANLHVTKTRHENDPIHNNTNINIFNERISEFANGVDVFYLDVNPLFDDEEGNLNVLLASDDSHILGEYYVNWCEWLIEHTVAK